ncbi:MAG: PAS domain S-box protein, partial [Armatimonadota bacterium]|nr:PAS domain S-box protein [Armatimonadota bacterium]
AREIAVADQQGEIDELEAQVAAAEERVEQARQAARAEQQEEIESLRSQLAEADRRAQEARESALAEQREEIEQLQSQLAEAEERVEQARQGALAEQQGKIDELQAQLAETEERAEQARQAALAEQQEEMESLKSQLADADRRAQEARESALAEQRQEIKELQSQLAEAEERVEQARQGALAEQQGTIDELQAQLAAVEERAEQARQAALAEQQEEIESLKSQLADADRRAQEARESALAEQQERIEELQAQLAEDEERIEEAREQAREAAREEFAARAAAMSSELASAERRVQEAREAALAEKQATIDDLSAQLQDAERRAAEAREKALAEQQATIDELQEKLEDAEHRAAEARKLAREEYETEIAQSLAEAEALEERLKQVEAAEDGDLRAELDRMAERLGEAERRAEEGAPYLRAVLDGIPYPVFFFDEEGRIQSCNEAFAQRILGLPREQLIGRTLRELEEQIPGGVSEPLKHRDRDVLMRGGEVAYEATVACADGDRRLYAFRKEAHREAEGKIVGIIGAMMDISALEAAKETVEQERRRAATVLSRAPAVVAEIMADGTTKAVYGSCEEILGYEPERLIDRNWWETLFPGELQEQLPDVLGAMRAGGDLEDRALVVQTAGGEQRIISWSTANARDENRELESILAVGYDITDRAQQQESLERRWTQASDQVKKFRCLCAVWRLCEDPALTLTEILSGAVAAIPPAWRHPGITTARIRVWDRQREAGESPYPPVATQSAEIAVNAEAVGEIEVRYHEERPEVLEGPFTAEERELLDTIAKRIGETIEHRSAEESLAKFRQFRHSLIEQANVWLMALDRQANVVLWNRAAEEISGYSREEVVGHDEVWEWLYPDERYRREVTHMMTSVIAGARMAENWETIIRRKDGTERVISWNSHRLIDDEDGSSIGSVALGRDVTEQRESVSADS